MTTFAYRDVFLNQFLELPANDQEELFAISCFEPSHWEAGPNWDLSKDEVNDEIRDYAERLLDNNHIRHIDRNDQWRDLINSFHHGDMINRLLARFIEERFGLDCKPEGSNQSREFDVTLNRDGMEYCSIGIKRMVTSANYTDYLQDHIDKYRGASQADCSACICYYPIGQGTSSNRVNDFISGYSILAPKIDFTFEQDHHVVKSIPAPLNPTDTDIQPLRKTAGFLDDKFDLRG